MPDLIGNGVRKNLSVDHSATAYTLAASAEQSLATVSAVTIGIAAVEVKGDGDALFKMRVYVDGSLDAATELSTDTAQVGAFTFSSTLEVRAVNTGSASQTGTSSSFNIRGVAN